MSLWLGYEIETHSQVAVLARLSACAALARLSACSVLARLSACAVLAILSACAALAMLSACAALAMLSASWARPCVRRLGQGHAIGVRCAGRAIGVLGKAMISAL